jgi:hypothetical protein
MDTLWERHSREKWTNYECRRNALSNSCEPSPPNLSPLTQREVPEHLSDRQYQSLR